MRVDIRSDTVTRPTAPMRAAMAAAEVGDDVYGDDPTVIRLEAAVADLLGHEAALFVPSGTMGNQICVFCHTQPGDAVLLEEGAHIFTSEAGAPAALSGVQVRPLRGDRGMLRTEQISAVLGPPDDHVPRPALLCLENTHNRAGGSVLPLEGMAQLARVAHGHGMRVHLDGARLWNASAASGHDLRAYATLADSVSVCFSKALGAPIGSMIAGTREFIGRARRRRKVLGGGMRQVGVLAAACLYALEHHRDRLPEDHARARRLAAGLAQMTGVHLDPGSVETNIVMMDVSPSGLTTEEIVSRAAEDGVLIGSSGRTVIRAVTHLEVDDAGVDRALHVLGRILDRRRTSAAS